MAGVATRSGGEEGIEKADVSSGQEAVVPESEIKKQLFRAAMESKWEEVVNIYKKNNFVPIAINRAGDTILHLAISMGKQDGVIKLMNLAEAANRPHLLQILETKNEMGDAPIHQAAFLGMDEVCLSMVEIHGDRALRARNRQDETPLHVAVLHGQKKAFFALQAVVDAGPQEGKDKTRNKAGDTILHTAILREHFDLAWEIIHMDSNLMDSVNIKGESALHILAGKPSAFKSGTDLTIIENFIYYSVPPLQPQLTYKKEHGPPLPQPQPTSKKEYGFWNDEDDEEAGITVSKAKVEGNQADRGGTVKRKQGIIPGSQNRQRHSIYLKLLFNIFMVVPQAVLLVFFGLLGLLVGEWKFTEIRKKFKEIEEKKRKNSYAEKIMEKLVAESTVWVFDIDGRKPKDSNRSRIDGIQSFTKKLPDTIDGRKPKDSNRSEIDGVQSFAGRLPDIGNQHDEKEKIVASSEKPVEASPLLMAAKRGVMEMVTEILEHSPASILEVDSQGKNIILLAAEYGQTDIYDYMLEEGRTVEKPPLFGRVDERGNSALHLAASLVEKRADGISGEATFTEKRTWNIPGKALQMQADVRWYKHIERSMPPNFFMHYNFKGETAQEIFTSNHKDMIKEAREWLTSTSASCSVIATLISTVAYTSANTVPGSYDDTGFPVFKGQPAFLVFAMSSLLAFGFSGTALVFFLSIITSRFHESDFEYKLPLKLIFGLIALFGSSVAMLISFCAGHFYTIHDKLEFGVYILYACIALPLIAVTFMSQIHLFMDLVRGTFFQRPKLSGKPYF